MSGVGFIGQDTSEWLEEALWGKGISCWGKCEDLRGVCVVYLRPGRESSGKWDRNGGGVGVGYRLGWASGLGSHRVPPSPTHRSFLLPLFLYLLVLISSLPSLTTVCSLLFSTPNPLNLSCPRPIALFKKLALSFTSQVLLTQKPDSRVEVIETLQSGYILEYFRFSFWNSFGISHKHFHSARQKSWA